MANAPLVAAGLRDKPVLLENPGEPVPDGGGGYTQTYTPLDPGTVWAAIVPVSARDQERAAVGTILSTASHVVGIPWHPEVTIDTRITWTDGRSGRTRVLYVTAVRDPDERGRQLELSAEERR